VNLLKIVFGATPKATRETRALSETGGAQNIDNSPRYWVETHLSACDYE